MIVGTEEEWKNYRVAFESLVAEAASVDGIPERGTLDHLFRRIDKAGTAVADSNGALWMEFSDGEETSPLGLSANNVSAPGTDEHLAYELILARIDRILKSPRHSRETMAEFKNDWDLLERVPRYSTESIASSGKSFGEAILFRGR